MPAVTRSETLVAPRTTTLILPGRGSSEPDHWQSLWEAANPAFRRVEQRDWHSPNCNEWCRTLESAVAALGSSRPILVAHSLACVMVAHWALRTDLPVRAALLVAPSNPDRPDFDHSAVGFSPVPRRRLPFPSILVASSNDPKGTLEYAAACAEAWGSRFVNVGAVGHINVASGLGDWPQGQLLYRQLEALAQPKYRASRQAQLTALSPAHN